MIYVVRRVWRKLDRFGHIQNSLGLFRLAWLGQKPRVRMAMPNAYTRPPIELLSDEAPIVYRATKLTVYGVQSLGVKRK